MARHGYHYNGLLGAPLVTFSAPLVLARSAAQRENSPLRIFSGLVSFDLKLRGISPTRGTSYNPPSLEVSRHYKTYKRILLFVLFNDAPSFDKVVSSVGHRHVVESSSSWKSGASRLGTCPLSRLVDIKPVENAHAFLDALVDRTTRFRRLIRVVFPLRRDHTVHVVWFD
ncbi:hypothetical protein Ae201684P_000193 [Aphanomyces euteiches]|uniref:Uncharacterized protein n=1 Tax=Aphanomyces euteiches TaxID=100861 RepID=A0A6G0XRT0_9STRA|nr:hypothetical protein Ae201684_002204 [Aphanomyces euteiches]KAH9086774.1 hypothetical protein Ae201684P_000193 [Aphanomyces euteiches]